MPVDLIDLDTGERYGPFDTPAEAEASAERSGFRDYELWENGRKLMTVHARTVLTPDPWAGRS